MIKIYKKILFLLFLVVFQLSQVFGQEIIRVVREGDPDRVKLLLEKDPDMVNSFDSRNCTPLHYASDGGNLEIVKILLEKELI